MVMQAAIGLVCLIVVLILGLRQPFRGAATRLPPSVGADVRH
jgi:hypothetical protein